MPISLAYVVNGYLFVPLLRRYKYIFLKLLLNDILLLTCCSLPVLCVDRCANI